MDEVCRICTGKNITLVNIFAKREQKDEEPPLVDMLNECANCEISLNDPLPQNICLSCTLAAQSAFQFKRKCEKSHQYFWQLLTDENKKKLVCEMIVPEDGPIAECFLNVVEIKKEQCDNQEQENSVSSEKAEDKPASSGTPIKSENTSQTRKKKTQICPTCGKQFLTKKKLSVHKRSHFRPYKCTHCSKAFQSSSTCKSHIRLHTGERPFECRHCKKTFMRNDELKRHMFGHTGERPYKCHICSKGFTHRSSLVKHTRSHTSGPENKTCQCPHCPRILTSSYRLGLHMRSHTIDRPYKCPYCPSSFGSKAKLSQHRHIHPSYKPYECKHCIKSFSKRSEYIRHCKAHALETSTSDHLERQTENSPEETSTNFDGLEDSIESSADAFIETHMEMNENSDHNSPSNGNVSTELCSDSLDFLNRNLYQCETCEESFTTKRDLNKHKCPNVVEPVFICGLCSKSFKHKGHFERHIGLHEKKFAHECANCMNSFSTKKKLEKHVCDGESKYIIS